MIVHGGTSLFDFILTAWPRLCGSIFFTNAARKGTKSDRSDNCILTIFMHVYMGLGYWNVDRDIGWYECHMGVGYVYISGGLCVKVRELLAVFADSDKAEMV
ncbi:hypothetical protein [Poriferisphaera sp. WC338]|uniref:hypothetical protein n=1 Tax=Poriferisphaera sp. WC338 TaxID=3425129 RepID=UPI003D818615